MPSPHWQAGSATWLITESDPDNADVLFGLCDLGMGSPELGSVSRAELEEVRGRFGLPLEREVHRRQAPFGPRRGGAHAREDRVCICIGPRRICTYLANERNRKMKHMNALAAIVAVSLATSGTASVSGAQSGSNEDEAAIRKVIVEMTEGFNNHDGKAAARMYAPDARFVSVRGDMMNGQAGIEKGLSAILTSRAKNATQ